MADKIIRLSAFAKLSPTNPDKAKIVLENIGLNVNKYREPHCFTQNDTPWIVTTNADDDGTSRNLPEKIDVSISVPLIWADKCMEIFSGNYLWELKSLGEVEITFGLLSLLRPKNPSIHSLYGDYVWTVTQLKLL